MYQLGLLSITYYQKDKRHNKCCQGRKDKGSMRCPKGVNTLFGKMENN